MLRTAVPPKGPVMLSRRLRTTRMSGEYATPRSGGIGELYANVRWANLAPAVLTAVAASLNDVPVGECRGHVSPPKSRRHRLGVLESMLPDGLLGG